MMIDAKRIEQIPKMREHACELRRLAKEVASSRSGPYNAYDFLGAMADVLMHKQIDHIKSICVLVDANQNPDALIIARSAYESMALLLWAAHGPPRKNRPRQWFLYEIKERYCRWVNGEYKDLGLSPEKERSVIQNVKTYANILLTKKGQDKLRRDRLLTCDQGDFTVDKLPPMVHIFGDRSLKGKIDPKSYALYQLLSKWPHGDPQGMAIVFQHDGNCLSHDETICKYLGGCAIEIGILSLNKTSNLFNEHFKLNFHDRLLELENAKF